MEVQEVDDLQSLSNFVLNPSQLYKLKYLGLFYCLYLANKPFVFRLLIQFRLAKLVRLCRFLGCYYFCILDAFLLFIIKNIDSYQLLSPREAYQKTFLAQSHNTKAFSKTLPLMRDCPLTILKKDQLKIFFKGKWNLNGPTGEYEYGCINQIKSK